MSRSLLRRLAVLALIPLVFVLTSCMRMQATYDIKSVDRVEVVRNVGVLKSAAESSEGQFTQDKMCDDSSTGSKPTDGLQDAKAESYDDGTYIGCKVTGWTTASALGTDDADLTLADGVWTFQMKSSGQATEATENAEQAAAMFSDFKISVTFPGKVLTHNGTSTVQGTTVTWTSAKDMMVGDEGLKATAEDGNGGMFPLWVWAVIGLVVLGGAAAAVWFVLQNRKKQQAAQQAQQQQPWDGSGAPYGQGYPQGDQGQWNQGQQGQWNQRQQGQWAQGQQGQYGQDQQWNQGQQWQGQPDLGGQIQQWNNHSQQSASEWGGSQSTPPGSQGSAANWQDPWQQPQQQPWQGDAQPQDASWQQGQGSDQSWQQGHDQSWQQNQGQQWSDQGGHDQSGQGQPDQGQPDQGQSGQGQSGQGQQGWNPPQPPQH